MTEEFNIITNERLSALIDDACEGLGRVTRNKILLAIEYAQEISMRTEGDDEILALALEVTRLANELKDSASNTRR